jgi:hypothetical protein
MSEKITIDRASRSSESRDKETRRKPWRPPSRLDEIARLGQLVCQRLQRDHPLRPERFAL